MRAFWARTRLDDQKRWILCTCLLTSMPFGCDVTKSGEDSALDPDGSGGATSDRAVNGTSGAGDETDPPDTASSGGSSTGTVSSPVSAGGADDDGDAGGTNG